MGRETSHQQKSTRAINLIINSVRKESKQTTRALESDQDTSHQFEIQGLSEGRLIILLIHH